MNCKAVTLRYKHKGKNQGIRFAGEKRKRRGALAWGWLSLEKEDENEFVVDYWVGNIFGISHRVRCFIYDVVSVHSLLFCAGLSMWGVGGYNLRPVRLFLSPNLYSAVLIIFFAPRFHINHFLLFSVMGVSPENFGFPPCERDFFLYRNLFTSAN